MELDDAYDNGSYVAESARYPDDWADAAAEWRNMEAAVGRARLNLSYGPAERNRFDLFYPAGRPAGLAVFVHGGYWRRFDRSFWSHFAEGCTAAGWACAIPSYTLAPQVRIAEITVEIGQAIAAAAAQVSGPVVLFGHSAGGHLVSRMAMEDAPLAADVAARLSRVVPISPVADLRPMLQTTLNTDLRLDAAEAAAESPVLGLPRPDIDVTVWVGSAERPAFLDQARWLAEAWGCGHRIAEGKHHFNVIDALRDPASPMIHDILGTA